MDQMQYLEYLGGKIADGSAVLFTGAGFSSLARNRLGQPLPSSRELVDALWSIAFPGTEYDGESSLADVYEAAVSVGKNTTGQRLSDLLTIPTGGLDDSYRVWLSVPWYRHYTLNLDNLDERASVDFHLPRAVTSVSALDEAPPPLADGTLVSVHLNGRVSEFPNVTFSDRQYAERTAAPDPWYRTLINDVTGRCVVFIGTSLNEPPLWQQIELRLQRGAGTKELRPRSFLVTPSLTRARQRVLEQYNVEWIPMSHEEFLDRVLATLSDQSIQGLASLRAREETRKRSGAVTSVSELRGIPSTQPRDYLLGREPEWGDVSDDGYAVVREFEQDLREHFDRSAKRILLVTGTAGSGKSTTLKRLAVEYDTVGETTYWIPSETELSLQRLRQNIAAVRAQVVVMDDVDVFGASSATFLDGLLADSEHIRIVAAVRSSRFRRLRLADEFEENGFIVTVPLLGDADIDLLLGALTAAGRLGHLRGMSRPEQQKVFRDRSGRELLVAMIEATSNEKFEVKIGEECDDLGNTAGYQYAAAALATSFREALTRDELLDVSGGLPNIALNDLRYLVDHRFIVERDGVFRVRHRVIADRAIDHFARRGQLADPITSLLWVMAARVNQFTPRHARERNMVVSLLSHEFLIRIGLGQAQVRGVYDSVEPLLSWDSHYWLQRGSYEVERGDLDLAKNFLDQARSLATDDYMVQTEWAYMTIKRAAVAPDAMHAQENVDMAMGELEDAVQLRGAADSYPYHVLGSQGLAWARRAPMDLPVRRQFLAHILAIVREGVRQHPRNPELRQLEHDLEHDYLMTATVDTASGDDPPSIEAEPT